MKEKEVYMKDEINPFIGKNIRYLRKKHEMGQEKLADMTGFKSFTTIQKWEAGDRSGDPEERSR